MRAWSVAALVALAVASVPASAVAQGAGKVAHGAPDTATRATARSLAEEAFSLFDKGDYAVALDRFDRADALVHAPTLGLGAARSLSRLGRLVDASERYLEVTRFPLDKKSSPAFRDAVSSAESELEALRPRVPSLTIVLQNGEGAHVTLDGRAVVPALIGVKQPIDPGAHKIAVENGGASVARTVTLREAEAKEIVIPVPTPETPAPTSTSDPPPVPASKTQRNMAIVGLGLGAVGVGVGVAFGVRALGERSDLDGQGCAAHVCPPSLASDVSRYNASRTVSTAFLIGGGVTLAVGVVLLATAPGPKRAATAARVLMKGLEVSF